MSVYRADTTPALRDVYGFDVAQLPTVSISAALWRDGKLAQLCELYQEVHGRSVLLQSVLAMSPDKLPTLLTRWRPELRRWSLICDNLEIAPVEAAVRIVAGHPDIDRLGSGPIKPLEAVPAA